MSLKTFSVIEVGTSTWRQITGVLELDAHGSDLVEAVQSSVFLDWAHAASLADRVFQFQGTNSSTFWIF